MHFSATGNDKRIRAVFSRSYAEGNVLQKLALKAVLDIAGCYEFSLASCKRRVVYGKRHFNRRLGNLYKRKRLRIFRVTYSIADCYFCDTGKTDNVSCTCLGNGNALKSFKLIHSGNFCLFRLTLVVVIADNDLLILTYDAGFNTSYCYSSYIFIIVDGGNKKAHRLVTICAWSRDVFDNFIKQRTKIRAFCHRVI